MKAYRSLKRKPTPNQDERRRYAERILETLSGTNREAARAFLKEKVANGLKDASVVSYAVSLRHFDRFLKGGDLRHITAGEATDFFFQNRDKWAPYTHWGHAANLRSFLRWAYADEIPKDLRQALRRKTPQAQAERRPIEEAEFRALLKATHTYHGALDRLKIQAMLWTFWDTGFRLGELLSLSVGAIEFDGRSGARIRLDPSAPGLKTGARTVYVVECVGAIQAWLAAHPHKDKPWAPLFPTDRGEKDPPYWPQNVHALLRRLCEKGRVRHIHPHLFRHTRATRAAKAGWAEAQMRMYFGWSRNSDMPSVYVHLAQADMEEQVRRDAGIDQDGRRPSGPTHPPPSPKDEDLRSAMRRFLLDDED